MILLATVRFLKFLTRTVLKFRAMFKIFQISLLSLSLFEFLPVVIRVESSKVIFSPLVLVRSFYFYVIQVFFL